MEIHSGFSHSDCFADCFGENTCLKLYFENLNEN